MRTKEEIFNGEDPMQFFLSCHPINGIKGFQKWCERVHDKPIKDFHLNWVKPLFDPLKTYKRIAIAAPTGFGKTELFAIEYPCYMMWYNKGWEALVVSTSMPQSRKIIQRLKSEIADNELLIDLKPTDIRKWSSEEILTSNNCNVACKPLNENVKSYHVNYEFCDEVASYHDRDCFKRWVSTRVGAKKGYLVAVSTFEGPDDLLSELLENPEYYHIITSAINEKGESIWPERFPLSFLMQRKLELGDIAFNLQYLSNPNIMADDPERQPFPFRLMVANSDPTARFEVQPIPGGIYYVAYDPAFTITGDYHAVIIARRNEKNKIFISRIYRFKSEPKEAINILNAIYYLYHPIKIMVDTSSGGGMILNDLVIKGLPCVGFPFIHENRNAGFRATVQELHKNNIIIPTSDNCSETKAMTDVLYNEMTHIIRDKTPKGLPTYSSTTKNDDVAMAFLMVIKSIVEEEPFISYFRAGCKEDVIKQIKDKKKFDGSVARFKIET